MYTRNSQVDIIAGGTGVGHLGAILDVAINTGNHNVKTSRSCATEVTVTPRSHSRDPSLRILRIVVLQGAPLHFHVGLQESDSFSFRVMALLLVV